MPHRGLGTNLASGPGMSQIQALWKGCLGDSGQEMNFGLPGMALNAWLPEELVRAAAFQGGVLGEVLPPPWWGQCC